MTYLILIALSYFSAGTATRVHDAMLCAFSIKHPTTYLGNPEMTRDAFFVCMEMVAESRRQRVPPFWTLSVAYTETRWRHGLVGSLGEIGPLQIMPKYYCPADPTTPYPKGSAKMCGDRTVYYGVKALKNHLLKYGNEDLATCHYKQGNTCGPEGREAAARVRRKTMALRGAWHRTKARRNKLQPLWSPIAATSKRGRLRKNRMVRPPAGRRSM